MAKLSAQEFIEAIKEMTVLELNDLVKACEEDGVDLIGYTTWGGIDLVSAGTGQMKKRYGFIYTDKQDDGTGTMKRSPKKSFYWYKKVMESQGEII